MHTRRVVFYLHSSSTAGGTIVGCKSGTRVFLFVFIYEDSLRFGWFHAECFLLSLQEAFTKVGGLVFSC